MNNLPPMKPLAALMRQSPDPLDAPCIIDTQAVTSWNPEPERDLLADMKAMIPTMMEEAEAHNQRVAELRDALLGRMAEMSTSELAEFMRDCRNSPAVMELMRPEPVNPYLPKMEFRWP